MKKILVQLQCGYPTNTNLWSTGETTSSISVQVVSDTTFWNTVMDGNGCVESDTIEISILTGFENKIKKNIKVFPNPAKDFLWVDIPYSSNHLYYSFSNMKGNLIKEGVFKPGKNSISLSNLPNASYQLLITTEEGLIVKKAHIIKH